MKNHDRDGWGDDGGLGSLLDAYAAARLRADPDRTGAVRARVLAEARRRSGERRDSVAPTARRPGRPWLFGRRLVRIPALAGAAWLLVGLMLAGGALAGSGPGGPFYGPRLWIEELTLPADPGDRVDAQVARLDARLAEARAEAAEGNGAAVTAALEAYRQTAEAAFVAAGVDPGRQEHLVAALGRHVEVLDTLADRVPARAAQAIRAAVERTGTRIEEILSTPPGKPVPPAASPGSGRPGTGPASGEDPGPSKTPPGKPELSPKPQRTPPGKPGSESPMPPAHQPTEAPAP